VNKFFVTYIVPALFVLVSVLIYAVHPAVDRRIDLNINTNSIWNIIPYSSSESQNSQRPKALVTYRQGNHRNAIFHVPELPNEITSVWSTRRLQHGIHSASKASVVGDGERLYVGTDTSWFYCLSQKTGEVLWKILFADSMKGIHSTAALDADFVYVGSYRGVIYKLNKLTGELIWSRIVGETIGASLGIDEESLLLNVETISPVDGYLIKLNKKTGQTIWQSENIGQQSHSSPALHVKSNLVVVGANNATLKAFDYTTGEKKWQKNMLGDIKSSIWVEGDVGYITTWGQNTLAFRMPTGEIVWDKKIFSAKSQVSPAVIASEQSVLVADSSNDALYVLDSKTGETKKKIHIPTVDRMFQVSSPVVLQLPNLKQYFLYTCEKRKLCLIDAAGNILKKWNINGHFTGSPWIDKGHIFFSYNDGGVEAFKLSGQLIKGLRK
jgi:outer membrane protein assembly factor BamB